jgi:hypothetical protein
MVIFQPRVLSMSTSMLFTRWASHICAAFCPCRFSTYSYRRRMEGTLSSFSSYFAASTRHVRATIWYRSRFTSTACSTLSMRPTATWEVELARECESPHSQIQSTRRRRC